MKAEFTPLLIECLEQCVGGRWGLFGRNEGTDATRRLHWPEADRLRELAREIVKLDAEIGGRSEICERFLGLCAKRGANDPGEPRLANTFLGELDREGTTR